MINEFVEGCNEGFSNLIFLFDSIDSFNKPLFLVISIDELISLIRLVALLYMGDCCDNKFDFIK